LSEKRGWWRMAKTKAIQEGELSARNELDPHTSRKTSNRFKKRNLQVDISVYFNDSSDMNKKVRDRILRNLLPVAKQLNFEWVGSFEHFTDHQRFVLSSKCKETFEYGVGITFVLAQIALRVKGAVIERVVFEVLDWDSDLREKYVVGRLT
jgi:hypothetical protein